MVSIAKKPIARILGRAPQAATTAPRKQLNGSYIVDSHTATLVAYNVRCEEHGWACDCPAGAFYKPCKHLLAVLALEAQQQAEMELASDLAAVAEYLGSEGDQDGQGEPDGGDDNPPPAAPAKPAKREVPDRRRWTPRRPRKPGTVPATPLQLFYRDGSPKPYGEADIKDGSFVVKAQQSWGWDDGEPTEPVREATSLPRQAQAMEV